MEGCTVSSFPITVSRQEPLCEAGALGATLGWHQRVLGEPVFQVGVSAAVIGKVLCRVEARPVGPQPWPTTPAGHVISWTPVSHPGQDPSTSPVHLPGVSKKSSVAITNLALHLRWTLSPFGYPASRHTFYLGESLLWENLGGRQKIYLLPWEAREASRFLSWNPLSPTSPSPCPLTHTHTHTHPS